MPKHMKIILDKNAAEFFYSTVKKWDAIAAGRWDFEDNWKRSPIARESRRESIVYGNCVEIVVLLLRNATDENGAEWWPKLHT